MNDFKNPFCVLPLRDIVVFPNMIVPLFVGRTKSIKALEFAEKNDKEIFLVAQRDANVDEPGVEDIYDFGTVATILQLLRLPDGTVKVLVEGINRVKITDYIDTKDFINCSYEKTSDQIDKEEDLMQTALSAVKKLEKLTSINKKISSENKLEHLAKISVENYHEEFKKYKLDRAANEVLSLAINTNLYLNDNQPWLLIKEKDNLPIVKEIIYNVLESTRIIGLLLAPLLPELSSKINYQLGSIYKKEVPWGQQLKWGLLISNSSLPKPSPVINKLEYE